MIKWLLRNNPALLGDLAEERASGRSRTWYLRQVLVAIARSILGEVREHPVLTLRAIGVALGIYFIAAAIGIFVYGVLYFYYFPMHAPSVNPSARWLVIPMEFLPSAIAGWVLARSHRACLEAALLITIPVCALANLPIGALAFTANVGGILAGAIVGVKRRESTVA